MSLRKVIIKRYNKYFPSKKLSYLKELLKAQYFNSTITDSKWFKHQSLSPGGWAVDYSLLYTLYRVLDNTRPKSIIEFGLGQSSKLIHQYADYFDNIDTKTVEHDANWISFFKNEVEKDYPINIQQMELKKVKIMNHETLSYDNMESLIHNKYNLILVDAPFGSKHFSRSQVLDLIPEALADDFCIIIDDFNRKGEKETAKEIKEKLEKSNIKYHKKVYSGSKEHILFCSKNFKFLTTLTDF